jgi:hypothetical protein
LLRSPLDEIETVPPAESLELLYLLSERFEKQAFASVRDMADGLRRMVRDAIIADPAEAIRLADGLTERQPENSPVGFVAGVCGGVIEVLRRDPGALSIFLDHPGVGGRLVRDCPGIAEAALNASTPANRRRVVDMLLEWCRAQRSQSVRSALRAELLPAVTNEGDAPLVDELLRDLVSADIPFVCDIVARIEAFDDEVLNSTAAFALTATGREEVRQWASTHACDSRRVAALVAASYPQDEQGIRGILGDYETDALKQRAIVVALIERVSKYSLPLWLERLLAAEPRVWAILLAPPDDAVIHELVSRLVRRIRRSAIARIDDAGAVVNRFAAIHHDDVIRDHAVRQVFSDFLEADSDEDRLRDWIDRQWVMDWISRAPRGVLRGEIANALSETRAAWMRGWRLLAALPQRICIENPGVTYDAINTLLQRCEPWEQAAAECWRAILHPVAYGDAVQVDLCAQALSFSFEHRSLPVDDVVAEAFFAVHDVAMRDEPGHRSFLFLTIRDWDKAKELRRTLVDAFYYGKWRASRFVLAAREPWLLRKLCKRMMRQRRGEAFLEAAYRELASDQTTSSKSVVDALRDILRAPGYHEDWD